MDVADFRRVALSLEGVEEGSHMGSPDFRVGGRIFATLAAQSQGYANLMLTPEVQADFVNELPSVFIPVAGGWGKNGATHVRAVRGERRPAGGCFADRVENSCGEERTNGKGSEGTYT
jgi:hypothetical protein